MEENLFEEELDDLCETTYTKDDDTLKVLLADAICYAFDCYGHGVEYLSEILEMNEGNVWDKFLCSGLFHDAIGKIIDEDENEVTVTTDY